MSVLSVTTQEAVEHSLVSEGLISEEQLSELKTRARKDAIPFFSLLVSEKLLTSENLTKLIAKATNVPYVNLSAAKIDPEILDLLPQETAERYMAVPLGTIKHQLVVAMLDSDNVQAVDFLSRRIGKPLKVYAASEEGIRQVLQQYSSRISQDMVSEMSGLSIDDGDTKAEKDAKQKVQDASAAISASVQDSPISKALNTILEFAAKNRASDIHIEPLPDHLQIRCRIDGILREIMKLPKSTEPPLISRIKILSNLKIDEHRVPQDGEFSVHLANKDIDLRIAISPVVWGEQVVIRLLDKTGTSLNLEDMGYHGRAIRTIRDGLKRSNGMILTSGPTGSGKSTSLYALLQEIKDDSINIVTLEDPVEYKMGGVNQIQVNADVGLTFGAGLRSILRQDPDVVMVGEIRDKETAELAVQAALTGHLVFSTLHTNSAAGILPRLLDMGIEPFLIASTVHTVIGQRLVRRIAGEPQEYDATAAEIEGIRESIGHLLPETEDDMAAACQDLGYEKLPLRNAEGYKLYKGIDKPEAPNGYKGRMGLYEVFDVSTEIQDLILKRATSSVIQDLAIKQGMVTMREDGYLKALAGYTTLSEVNRVAAANSA